MARMRTITQVIQLIRQQDPDSAISEWWLRTMLKAGKIKHHRAGIKYLIDVDYLEEYLKNPPVEDEEIIKEYGILRKVNS